MFGKIKCFRLVTFLVLFSIGQQIFAEHIANDASDFNSSNNNSSNEISEKSFSWLEGAKNMLSTPTGNVVVRMAKELINRSTGNNQVLSLNLTNLIVILLLKVLIFTAAFLGAGHLGYGGYGYGYNYARSAGRSIDAPSFGLSNGEDSLVTAFLAAQGSGIDDCLYAAACANPEISSQYTKAAKAIMEGIKKFEGTSMNNPRYFDLINIMEKASYDGFRGLSCNTTTDCSNFI